MMTQEDIEDGIEKYGDDKNPGNLDVRKILKAIYALNSEKAEIQEQIKILKELAKLAGFPAKSLTEAMRFMKQETTERDIMLTKANQLIVLVGGKAINLHASIGNSGQLG